MNVTTQHKFYLDRSSKKFNCPGCGQRRFVRYKEDETGEYLHESVGRCDREDRCGYHLKPREYFAENNITRPLPLSKTKNFKESPINRPVDFLPDEVFYSSTSKFQNSDLFPFLETLFRERIAKKLCEDYFIGCNWEGHTDFWQVDIFGNVRQCKTIKYGPDGHRDKSAGVFFTGKKILNNPEANLRQCFFGEHLLSYPQNNITPVALVESEKTAVVASVHFPDFVWLATGGKHGARWTEANVCKVLNRRKVVLFPDLGAFDAWKSKGLLMAAVAGCKVAVSDILEMAASEQDRREGLDLVDYLLRVQDSSRLALTDLNYPVIFDYSDKRTI